MEGTALFVRHPFYANPNIEPNTSTLPEELSLLFLGLMMTLLAKVLAPTSASMVNHGSHALFLPPPPLRLHSLSRPYVSLLSLPHGGPSSCSCPSRSPSSASTVAPVVQSRLVQHLSLRSLHALTRPALGQLHQLPALQKSLLALHAVSHLVKVFTDFSSIPGHRVY